MKTIPLFLTLSFALAGVAFGQESPSVVPFAWSTALPLSDEWAYTPMVLEPGSDGSWFVGVDSYGNRKPFASNTRAGVSKINSDGTVQWHWEMNSPRFDAVQDLAVLPDGGCTVLITSGPSASSALRAPFWRDARWFHVVKLDARGEAEWRKDFGGRAMNAGREIHLMPDGGYLIGAISSMPSQPKPDPTPEEVPSEKRAPALGKQDVWLIRLSPQGELLWDRTLGGPEPDWLFGSLNNSVYMQDRTLDNQQASRESNADLDHDLIALAPDGGAVVGYTTYPGEIHWSNVIDPRVSAHLARVDSQGNLLWERTFDGSEGDTVQLVTRIPDGGYLMAGMTESGLSGNKTSPAYGKTDVWLARVTDEGKIAWDTAIGGAGQEVLQAILPAPRGSFLVSLLSDSKTLHEVPGVRLADAWLVKLDAGGRLHSLNPYGGLNAEVTRFGANVVPLPDGSHWLAVESSSPSGSTRTANNTGIEGIFLQDLWMIRVDARGRKMSEFAIPHARFNALRANAQGDVVLAFDDGFGREALNGRLMKLFSQCSTTSRMWISRRSVSNTYFSVEAPCGVAYAIEASADLTPESWRPLLSLLGTGVPQEFPLILDRKAKSQFFRLSLFP